MPTSPDAAFSRPTLGFALEGLSCRDETLFKAVVRLLDHRTLQRWVHQPTGPDVRVVAEVVMAAEGCAVCPDVSAPLVLTISANPGDRPHCLRLPLRANELEAVLNRLGDERIGTRRLPHAGARTEMHTAVVRLLRWPPPQLLGTPERVRLATLMVNRPITLIWLQQRAGIPPTACMQFLAELHDAGLLATAENTPVAPAALRDTSTVAAPVAAPERSGLLTRIRNRLGLLVRPMHA